ncbi:hypothetical protein I302_104287 [Kwoniella bestiolae CBS 10118]|uniref:Uncharacterized protein n=1 Tax=Kwoniella bestiolae CBS 10118 TaxID=1296100 RepID=A0A1B9GAU0_9TREE|nr:hypothetical protein I302_02994 [Kwoniella bestiolae CBS 10118]OCF28143.1 hypothetical protein I302_02994 [Kwoniella bestiolae CBS 10118]
MIDLTPASSTSSLSSSTKRRFSPPSEEDIPYKKLHMGDSMVDILSTTHLTPRGDQNPLDEDTDMEEEEVVVKKDKGKGKMKMVYLPELPEEVWTRIFEIYYEDRTTQWQNTGILHNGLTPVLLSRDHARIALPVLYRHPYVGYKAITPFIAALGGPPRYTDLPYKDYIKHFTVRASPIIPSTEFSAFYSGRKNPDVGTSNVAPYTIHPSFDTLMGILPELSTFTLKDTLILHQADASLLFHGLRYINPKKARLEFRMWDLYDSPYGQDIIGATRGGVYNSYGSKPSILPSPDLSSHRNTHEVTGVAIQKNWRDALYNATELDLPPWWIEPSRPEAPAPIMPLGPWGAAPALLANQPINLASRLPPQTQASTQIPNILPNPPTLPAPPPAPAQHSPSITIPSNLLGDPGTQQIYRRIRQLVDSRSSDSQGPALSQTSSSATTLSTPFASTAGNQVVTDLSSAHMLVPQDHEPGDSADNPLDFTGWELSDSEDEDELSTRPSSISSPDLRLLGSSRYSYLRATSSLDTNSTAAPPRDTSRDIGPSWYRPTPSRGVPVNQASTSTSIVTRSAPSNTAMIQATVPAPQQRSQAFALSDYTGRRHSPVGQNNIAVGTRIGPGGVPLAHAPGMTWHLLAHHIRALLLELIREIWTPRLQALSVVALDPLASLTVRAPQLDFWTQINVPHIRVHLPRSINSLAVLKGAKEVARDRARRRREGEHDDVTTVVPPLGPVNNQPEGEDDHKIVGGDGSGNDLINEEVRLFEVEINSMEEMRDEVWIRFGDQLPPQLCRILAGEHDWRDVSFGHTNDTYSPPHSEYVPPDSPATSDFDSPTFSFVSLGESDDELGVEIDEGEGNENDTYDKDKADEQAKRMRERGTEM